MSTIYRITWTRKGKCDRQKCRAACCRALNDDTGSFANDLGVTPGEMQVLFAHFSCSNINELSASFDCKIYKNRPTLCREFPSSPWDGIYQRVKGKCTYWFEIQIKKVEIQVSPSPTDSPSPALSPLPSPSIDTNGGR